LKRKEVIDLPEERITCRTGCFEAHIAINEQCAHRSANEYGSPNTRFFFLIQVFEKANQSLRSLGAWASPLIKVVAPGKGKPANTTTSHSSSTAVIFNNNNDNTPVNLPQEQHSAPLNSTPSSPVKAGAAGRKLLMKGKFPTIKQMVETMFVTMSEMNERITNLERENQVLKQQYNMQQPFFPEQLQFLLQQIPQPPPQEQVQQPVDSNPDLRASGSVPNSQSMPQLLVPIKQEPNTNNDHQSNSQQSNLPSMSPFLKVEFDYQEGHVPAPNSLKLSGESINDGGDTLDLLKSLHEGGSDVNSFFYSSSQEK
jgi:hypothetical protein